MRPVELNNERYFEMNVRLIDQFYMVRVDSDEGQPSELLAAVKEVVEAAKKLAVVVSAIDYPDDSGIMMVTMTEYVLKAEVSAMKQRLATSELIREAEAMGFVVDIRLPENSAYPVLEGEPNADGA